MGGARDASDPGLKQEDPQRRDSWGPCLPLTNFTEAMGRPHPYGNLSSTSKSVRDPLCPICLFLGSPSGSEEVSGASEA